MTPAVPLVRSRPGDRPLATQDKPSVPDEKRRTPRVALAKGTRAQIKSTLPVALLNLSATGILMELSTPLRPGSTCDLSATLGGVPLAALVRITRCRAGGFAVDGKGGRILLYLAAGEFVGLSDQQFESLGRAIEAIGGAKLRSESSAFLKRVRPS